MKYFILIALLVFSGAANATTPEEQLANPLLEQRARDLSQQLRCLTCENQSIDDSEAELAQDLRQNLRQQITQGRSDDEILADFRQRYGDQVLLKPPLTPATYGLWLSPLLLIIAAVIAFILWRRGAKTDAELPDENKSETVKNSAPQQGQIPPAYIMLGLGAMLMAISLGLYGFLGRPDMAAQPFTQRGDEIKASKTQADDNKAALNNAIRNAENNPDSVAAQLDLALIAASIGNSDIEIKALENALELTNHPPAIQALMAEALGRKADGLVTLPARALIAAALSKNPNEPRALYLSGLAAFQDGDYSKSISIWQQLQNQLPPDNPWADVIAENIEDALAAGGEVANDTPNLIAALARFYAQELSEVNITAANEILAELESRIPHHPEFLFFKGYFAKAQGQIDTAIKAWSELAAQLPPNHDATTDLKKQIEQMQESR